MISLFQVCPTYGAIWPLNLEVFREVTMQEWLKNILNPSTESKIEGVKDQDITLQAAIIADKSSLQEINDLVASVAQGIVFREVPTLQE